MIQPTSRQLVRRAWELGLAIPSFNVPHPPMMAPIIRALRDTNTVGQVSVAQVEWKRFTAGGVRPVFEAYQGLKDERFTRLHLDHIPVLDEDGEPVDYAALLAEALALGYDSVMVDGSRLSLEENIAATRRVVEMAQRRNGKRGTVPIFAGEADKSRDAAGEIGDCPSSPAVEGELGAVFGHEAGPPPPYEELFTSGRGFTDPDEARRFVQETGVDWLSVAIGNIHGAVSGAARDQKKVRARLNLEHLEKLRAATGVPLVLHGGSGIGPEYVRAGIAAGIAKINIATNIRQPYEAALPQSVAAAQQAVYDEVVRLVSEELQLAGSAAQLVPCSS
jgi:fructose-bisphosphate aldolase class II